MKTQILQPNDENIFISAKIILNGGLVAMPTETVYGLAANAFDESAVKKIFEAKGRPSDNPLIVHISDFEQLNDIVVEIPENARKLAEKFWPGPLTMVFKSKGTVPSVVTAGMDTIAVRMPSHNVARKLIEKSVPIAAPSANVSGSPSPTTAKYVFDDMKGKIPVILDGGECKFGVESTVISVVDNKARLLRPGGISLEDLKETIGEVEVDPSILQDIVLEKVSSPGMKHKHYSPFADVILIKGDSENYAKYVNNHKQKGVYALCFDEDIAFLDDNHLLSLGKTDDFLNQSHNLFSYLRKMDEMGAKTVFAHCSEICGLGLAVYNRLLRAAAFDVIDLNGAPVIGITGQSGSGKSTVSLALQDMGGKIIDADKIAHSVLENKSVIEKIQSTFGSEIVENGVVNRKELGRIVFSSRENTEIINNITHPEIIKEIKKQIEFLKHQNNVGFIVLDAPLLFECGLHNFCNYTLSVLSETEKRISRITERDNISKEAALERLKMQNPDEFYIEKSNYVIYNNGDINNLNNEIKGMLNLWQIPHRQ